jgi:hypothetical protein
MNSDEINDVLQSFCKELDEIADYYGLRKVDIKAISGVLAAAAADPSSPDELAAFGFMAGLAVGRAKK